MLERERDDYHRAEIVRIEMEEEEAPEEAVVGTLSRYDAGSIVRDPVTYAMTERRRTEREYVWEAS